MLAGHRFRLQRLGLEHECDVALVQRRQRLDQLRGAVNLVVLDEAHDVLGRELFRQGLGMANLRGGSGQQQAGRVRQEAEPSGHERAGCSGPASHAVAEVAVPPEEAMPGPWLDSRLLPLVAGDHATDPVKADVRLEGFWMLA